MTTRAVIYARYSSSLQSESSIEDQVHQARALIETHGWNLINVYSDAAVSGATTLRPGYQKLLEDARDHQFDVVVAEGLDRLSRDQEDIAGLYKLLSFDAAEDADITLKLHKHLWGKLQETDSLRKVYEEIEQPLVSVLLEMEETGVLIDREMLKTQSGELAKTMLDLESKAHELAGGPFNLGSPKQLQQILFTELGLPVIRKTPKGHPQAFLIKLSENIGEHPPVVTVPIALEPLFGIVLPLEAEKFRELGVTAEDLLAGSILVVGQVIAPAAANRHVNESSECCCRVL